MNKLRLLGAFCACVLTITSTPAAAVLLYDNGLPDHQIGINGQNLTENQGVGIWQADNFVLSSDATIDSINFWTFEGVIGTAWNGDIDWWIFSDDGGVPFDIPVASGAGANIIKTATGDMQGTVQFEEFSYSLDLDVPVNLQGNTQYYLGLRFPTATGIYWSAHLTAFGGTQYSLRNRNGLFDSWVQNGNVVDLAFQLNGSAVPIPAAAWLFGSGLLGLVGMARRKKA